MSRFVIRNSRGKLIHLLHGDDKIMSGFYKEIERIFNANSTAKAAFCRSLYIDNKSRWTGITGMIQEHEGIVENMAAQLYVQQKIQTPSMVVKREVYETIGAFDRRLNAMEDWEMWTRIANNYPIAISNSAIQVSPVPVDDNHLIPEERTLGVNLALEFLQPLGGKNVSLGRGQCKEPPCLLIVP